MNQKIEIRQQITPNKLYKMTLISLLSLKIIWGILAISCFPVILVIIISIKEIHWYSFIFPSFMLFVLLGLPYFIALLKKPFEAYYSFDENGLQMSYKNKSSHLSWEKISKVKLKNGTFKFYHINKNFIFLILNKKELHSVDFDNITNLLILKNKLKN